MSAKIFFDVTSLARWNGPPVGIVRVQQNLAQYARQYREDVVFTLYDPDCQARRAVRAEWLDAILAKHAVVEMSMLRDPTERRRRFHDDWPPRARSVYYWLTKTRRKSLFAAEAWRLNTRSTWSRQLADAIVSRLMKRRERNFFFDHHGQRRACPSFAGVVDGVVEPGPGDVTIAAQFDWSHTSIREIARKKQRLGFRHVVLCYDLIPDRFPAWYFPHDVDAFRDYYERALSVSDLVVVNAHCTSRDVDAFCTVRGIPVPPIVVVSLGADPPLPVQASVRLPAPCQPGKYALFVSTIEPRKNHAMIVDVWRRLLAEGIPQRHEFSLVFVGRTGWKMDEFIPTVQRDAAVRNSVHFLHGVEDAVLARLYHDAAFCLYPPIYEGFGLPAAEAIAYGKPLLASDGGAIPEAVGDAAACLDPSDAEAWYRHMREWIVNPAALSAAQPSPMHRQRTLDWHASAQEFFAAIDRVQDGVPVPSRSGRTAA